MTNQEKKAELQAKLVEAIKLCKRFEIPPHMVRNCPSDLQNSDMAWRKRKDIEFQLRQLEAQ